MRSNQRDNGASVIGRATDILGAFRAEDGPVGVSELARRTGIAKSTVSRLVAELVAVHMLERQGRSVRPGVRLFELGELAARPRDLRKAAVEHMADLHRATGHTVHLAVLEETDVVYIDIIRGRQGPPLPSRVGGRMPAHATGLGKAMLAYADHAVIEQVLRHGLTRMGPRTITSPDVLLGELERIRATGVAYEREESASNVGCGASPIGSPTRPAVAAISVSGWSGRLDVRRVGPTVKLAALGISRRLHVAPDRLRREA